MNRSSQESASTLLAIQEALLEEQASLFLSNDLDYARWERISERLDFIALQLRIHTETDPQIERFFDVQDHRVVVVLQLLTSFQQALIRWSGKKKEQEKAAEAVHMRQLYLDILGNIATILGSLESPDIEDTIMRHRRSAQRLGADDTRDHVRPSVRQRFVNRT